MEQQMRSIIDIIVTRDDPAPRALLEQRKKFLILAKAFSLGIIDTDSTLLELLHGSISDYQIDRINELIVMQEGPFVKHTI